MEQRELTKKKKKKSKRKGKSDPIIDALVDNILSEEEKESSEFTQASTD